MLLNIKGPHCKSWYFYWIENNLQYIWLCIWQTIFSLYSEVVFIMVNIKKHFQLFEMVISLSNLVRFPRFHPEKKFKKERKNHNIRLMKIARRPHHYGHGINQCHGMINEICHIDLAFCWGLDRPIDNSKSVWKCVTWRVVCVTIVC